MFKKLSAPVFNRPKTIRIRDADKVLWKGLRAIFGVFLISETSCSMLGETRHSHEGIKFPVGKTEAENTNSTVGNYCSVAFI